MSLNLIFLNNERKIICGVPQVSLLGPLTFNILILTCSLNVRMTILIAMRMKPLPILVQTSKNCQQNLQVV